MPFFIPKNLIRKWVPFFPESAKIDHLYHGRTADALRYVLPPIKIGDLFVLNSYKDKLYIKMLGFSKEID